MGGVSDREAGAVSETPIQFATRLDWIPKWMRPFFCKHDYKNLGSHRYTVTRNSDGSKEGEVTLTLFECQSCGKDKLFASDRTHV